MTAAFYNDNEPYVVEWLRNLVLTGEISQGEVSGESIRDIEGWQLTGYKRCHFFAGIGGWDYALRLAGWPAEREVWTGSCPCQPFSIAGKRKGADDERHLWPEFYRLIRECRPATIFGEQVASADGRKWLAGVFADLESVGYTVAGADLCAAGVGAPHIRQRLYWLANSSCERRQEPEGRDDRYRDDRYRDDRYRDDRYRDDRYREEAAGRHSMDSKAGGVAFARSQHARGCVLGPGEGTCAADERASGQLGRSDSASRMGDANNKGSQGRGEHTGEYADQWAAWTPSELIPCADGKTRRIEPGTFPLAYGIPARVGKLRAYGNAIVPQVAATFIRAFMEAE